MLVLLSHPEQYPGEADLLNRMLAANGQFGFHLRKPGMERVSFEQLLSAIDAVHHPRIVLHQHHELVDRYELKGIHFTAADRQEKAANDRVVSTSFHSLAEAQENEESYDYFFCSPVFPSISKPGYAGTEAWNISGTSAAFRKKAVALGGIDSNTLVSAKERGFLHYAVLGAVWQDDNPEQSLLKLLTTVI